MTIIEGDGWNGEPIDDVRPHGRVRMLQQLKRVAEDQASIYKSLTGIEVPNAPGVTVADDHIHDGVNGAAIPLPLAHGVLNATLDRALSPGGYGPLVWVPFRAPPGVGEVRLNIFTPDFRIVNRLRASIQSTSFTTTAGPVGRLDAELIGQSGTLGDLHHLSYAISVTPDATQLLLLEALDSIDFEDGTPVRISNIAAFSLTPWLKAWPKPPPLAARPRSFGGQVVVPPTFQHLLSRSYTSTDDAMYDDDRAVSSYLVQAATLNEAMLLERVTGLPAATNDDGHTNSQQYDGHSHGGATIDAPTNEVGAEMDHVLGSWFLGVMRGEPDNTLGHRTDDFPSGITVGRWSGRILAPFITSGTSYEILHEEQVRLPRGLSTSYNGGGSKLRMAALVFLDTGKTASADFKVELLDETRTTLGPATVFTTTTNGRHVISLSGVEAPSGTAGGDIAIVRVSIRQAASTNFGFGVYGSTMWFEA